MSLSRTKFPKHSVTLFACCFVGLWALSSPCLADDLFVGSFSSPGGVLKYNGTTGGWARKSRKCSTRRNSWNR